MNKIILSISNRDADAEIIKLDPNDEMKTVIKCPYCGQLTTVGKTRMISGFVGCDNCYFVEDGLLETVTRLRNNNYPAYISGAFYRRGFKDCKVIKK